MKAVYGYDEQNIEIAQVRQESDVIMEPNLVAKCRTDADDYEFTACFCAACHEYTVNRLNTVTIMCQQVLVLCTQSQLLIDTE